MPQLRAKLLTRQHKSKVYRPMCKFWCRSISSAYARSALPMRHYVNGRRTGAHRSSFSGLRCSCLERFAAPYVTSAPSMSVFCSCLETISSGVHPLDSLL